MFRRFAMELATVVVATGFAFLGSTSAFAAQQDQESNFDRVEVRDLGYVQGSDYSENMKRYLPKVAAAMECQSPTTGPSAPRSGTSPLLGPAVGGPLDTLDLIINIGNVLWSIVKNGQPVFQETMNSATALPQGTKCWTELTRWKRPVMKRFEYRFFTGISYTSMTLAVVAVTGGQKAGHGKYIAYASGFTEKLKNYGLANKLSLNVSVPVVYNEGDETEPVGALLMTLKVANDSPLVDRIEGKAVVVTGAGVVELSNNEVTP